MENQFKTNLREGKIVETAERIVIDYANCSGREDTNRAAFRGMVTGHLNLLVDSFLSSLEEEVKKEKINLFNGSGCKCGREWWFRQEYNKLVIYFLSLIQSYKQK